MIQGCEQILKGNPFQSLAAMTENALTLIREEKECRTKCKKEEKLIRRGFCVIVR